MTNEVAEWLAKVGSEMRVELSRCEVRRPPFYSTGLVCLSIEASSGTCHARSSEGNRKPPHMRDSRPVAAKRFIDVLAVWPSAH